MEKNRIAVLLNSPSLGGAERSIIGQVQLLEKSCDVTFFIPIIGGGVSCSKELIKLIKGSGSSKIYFYKYPKTLYRVSRSRRNLNFFYLGFSLLKMILILKKLRLARYDVIWANGNKVGLTSFLFSIVMSYKGMLVWHFRDYPAMKGVFKYIWKLLRFRYKFKVKLVGNSDSVCQDLKKISKGIDVVMLYNPVSKFSITRKELGHKKITIGLVGMLAPWKGIHEMLFWSSIYSEKLEELGVSQIEVFGDEIYLTSGKHTHYKKQLTSLLDKFPSQLVVFKGLAEPAEIFDRIDILIHSSTDKEPFGRVLAEALANGVPVISTGLGGAGEIIQDEKTGSKFISNDPDGLFRSLFRTITDRAFREKIVSNGYAKQEEIEVSIKEGLNSIFHRG